MKFKALLPLLLASTLPLAAADGARRAHVEASVRFLADDLLEGRGTPGRGQETAALWLATKLSEYGWSPAFSGSYLQRYTVARYRALPSSVHVEINGVPLKASEYLFAPQAVAPNALQQPVDIVFAGYGIDAPERRHSDFRQADVAGRAVMVVPGAPWPVPNDPLSYEQFVGKSTSAALRGAAMTIVVVPSLNGPLADRDPNVGLIRSVLYSGAAFLPQLRERRPSTFGPVLAITNGAFDRILAKSAGFTARRFASAATRRSGSVIGQISVAVDTSIETSRPANVAAVLRGTDPALRDEWIVISAHYDHLGVDDNATHGDRVYNGADDNASGTSAALDLARTLALRPHRRSILVLLDSGEERGLLGSAFFAAYAPIPLDRVLLDINIDMIGRSHGSVEASTYGSSQLFDVIRSLASNDMRVVPDRHPQWRTLMLSDDYNFARRGVPSVEFFTGLHPDYHQPSDEADSIRYDELARIVDLIERVAVHFADGAAKPDVSWPAWFELERR